METPQALEEKELAIHFFKSKSMKLFTIPNLMTLGNLLCGCLGLFFIFEGNLIAASYLIFLAGILDFLDGFVARLLGQHSEIGKQLDSLADMVTFGVLPSVLMVKLIQSSTMASESINYQTITSWLPYLGLAIALFSCLRLAKFNIDTRQSTSFIGLPTPANAFVVASLPMVLKFNPEFSGVILNTNILVFYTLFISYLLIAEIPLFAIKFKDFGWQSNKIKYLFLAFALIIGIFFQFLAIPLIIFMYVLISIIDNFTKKS